MGDQFGGGKRLKPAPNPYLQSSSSSFAKRSQQEVFAKRNRRGERALMFGQEDEEEEQQQQQPPMVLQKASQVPLPPAPRRALPTHVVPRIEWWDAAFLPKDHSPDDYDEEQVFAQLAPSNHKTFAYVEHPVPVPPTKQSEDGNEPLKLYQTKKELKKIRRLNRAVLTQEKRDKIAIGLMPAPQPKVRISNLLRVIANEHAADPTQIEARVRQEMEQRQLQHVARNLAKKLTPRERADKIKRRIQGDVLPGGGVCVAVFAIHGHGLWNMDEANELAKKRLARVVLTARKLLLTGRFAVVAAPRTVPGVLVVEGGPKSVRKLTRLACQRIDWKSTTLMESEINKAKRAAAGDEEDEDDDEEEDEDEENSGEEAPANRGGGGACALLWQGVASKHEFDGFRTENLESVLDARQLFAGKNSAHLWDLALANSSGVPRQ